MTFRAQSQDLSPAPAGDSHHPPDSNTTQPPNPPATLPSISLAPCPPPRNKHPTLPAPAPPALLLSPHTLWQQHRGEGHRWPAAHLYHQLHLHQARRRHHPPALPSPRMASSPSGRRALQYTLYSSEPAAGRALLQVPGEPRPELSGFALPPPGARALCAQLAAAPLPRMSTNAPSRMAGLGVGFLFIFFLFVSNSLFSL